MWNILKIPAVFDKYLLINNHIYLNSQKTFFRTHSWAVNMFPFMRLVQQWALTRRDSCSCSDGWWVLFKSMIASLQSRQLPACRHLSSLLSTFLSSIADHGRWQQRIEVSHFHQYPWQITHIQCFYRFTILHWRPNTFCRPQASAAHHVIWFGSQKSAIWASLPCLGCCHVVDYFCPLLSTCSQHSFGRLEAYQHSKISHFCWFQQYTT